jgi:hypothetical protein
MRVRGQPRAGIQAGRNLRTGGFYGVWGELLIALTISWVLEPPCRGFDLDLNLRPATGYGGKVRF